MAVDLSSCLAMTKEDVEAKSSKLVLEKMDAKELSQKIAEYEFKIMRLEKAINDSNTPEGKREILQAKIQNRTEAYYLMTKQLEVVK